MKSNSYTNIRKSVIFKAIARNLKVVGQDVGVVTITIIIMDVVISIIVLHFNADTKDQRTNLQRRNVSQES